MSLYQRVADLPLLIEGYDLRPIVRKTTMAWTRRTTVVVLRGSGHEGVGEDVTYQEADQVAFVNAARTLPLVGRHRFADVSSHLDAVDPFPTPPAEAAARFYRRWAFESAALDLALRQRGRSLADVLERRPRPLRFVASLDLGDPPRLEPLRRLRRLNPDLEFKIDYDDWTPEIIEALSGIEGVRAIDLKGQYRGAFRGPAADAARYRLVADTIPRAWIEDPEWNPETAEAFRPHLSRIAWDAPIHSVADIERLPFPPRGLNMKPSRFGSVSALFAAYEHWEARGIAMYGGGQFELGPGRGQAQYLAALFHPDAPNDLAPRVYNDPDPPPDLPKSPLDLVPAPAGFRLESP